MPVNTPSPQKRATRLPLVVAVCVLAGCQTPDIAMPEVRGKSCQYHSGLHLRPASA
jgi:hypothetical protein